MGNSPGTAQDDGMNRPADKHHLDELLDAALAGTFPASDPTSSFVSERERPASGKAPAQGGAPGDEREEEPDQQ